MDLIWASNCVTCVSDLMKDFCKTALHDATLSPLGVKLQMCNSLISVIRGLIDCSLSFSESTSILSGAVWRSINPASFTVVRY